MDDPAQHDLAPLPSFDVNPVGDAPHSGDTAPAGEVAPVVDALQGSEGLQHGDPPLAATAAPEPVVAEAGEPPPGAPAAQGLAQALRELAERVEQGVTANVALLDRMHAELERQKGDLLTRALSPLLFEIVGLHDQLLDVMESVQQANADLPSERVVGLFDVLRSRCEAILGGAGVFPFREESREFNPRRQRVVKRVLRVGGTGEVERSLGPGFERGSEVFCKERVELCVRWP